MNFIIAKRAELIAELHNYDISISQLSPMWRDDKLLMLDKFARLGRASARLQDDEDVVYSAVVCYHYRSSTLKYASARLRCSFEFMKRIIIGNGDDCWHSSSAFMRYIGDNLKNDIEFINLAHSLRTQSVLAVAGASICDNKNIVLPILATGGHQLRFISERLRDDFDIVFVAISNRNDAITYASDRLKLNRSLTLLAVRDYGYVFYHLANVFKTDIEIMKVSTMNHPKLLVKETTVLLRDLRFIEKLLCRNYKAFKHISLELKNDYDLAVCAVGANVKNIKHIGARLVNNQRFLCVALCLLNHWVAEQPEHMPDSGYLDLECVQPLETFNDLFAHISQSVFVPRGYSSADVFVCVRVGGW